MLRLTPKLRQFPLSFSNLHISITLSIFVSLILIEPSYQLSPTFLTNLNDCKTGNAVLTVSSPTTSNGFDTTTTTVTFTTAFTSNPNVAIGFRFLQSTFTTVVLGTATSSLDIWCMDLFASNPVATSFSVNFNRTSGIVSQMSINYIAVVSTLFLQITYSKIDFSTTSLFTQSNQTRSIPRNITYRTKSNSTNAVVALNSVGMYLRRQFTNTFSYTATISGQYSTVYEVTTTVPANNQLNFLSVYGICYQSIATTVSPPMYLSIGYVSDFSGTIPQNSGASGISANNMGIIYTAMVQWAISDSNGVNNYNFSLAGNAYQIVSNSLIGCRNSYVWYRQQTCPDYYYLSSHNCIACDITCNTCSGTLSTSCLTCVSTRSYNSNNKTCTCLTGYVEQGSRDCILVTCNVDLCRTCSNINQCGSCYAFLFRVLTGTECVCMPYRFDRYSIDGNPYCDACHYSCLTCTNSGANSCSSCNQTRDHRSFISSNSTCTCLTGYYDTTVTICTKCQYSCASCVAGTHCITCNNTKGRIFDNTSTYCACTSGQYDNLLQQQCLNCMYSCSTCTNGLSCSSCPSTRQLTNTTSGNSQCSCIAGYYDNFVSGICLSCQYTCYKCLSTAQCDSCSSAMHRQYNNITKFCICSTGYYDDGLNQLCVNCYLMCLACTGAGTNTCTNCDSSKYRTLALTGECVCMNGYYQVNILTTLCATCYYSCATCINSYSCTSCNAAKFRVQSGSNSSQCICINGYYDTGNEICTKCPYYCLTCTNSSSCLTCDPATRNIALNCLCLDGFYDNGVDKACQPCLSQCLTCNNPFNCTSCTPTIKYLASTSRCKCSPGYLQPSCEPCSYQCSHCSISSDNCVQCNGLYYRYYSFNNVSMKGQCLCYTGYYSDNINSLCKPCQFSCKSCVDSTSCLTCPSTRQFDSTSTFCTCLPQYYQNSQSLNCLQCHYSCSNCSDYALCTACNSAQNRIVDPTGVSKLCLCNPGFYDNGINQLCYSCSTECLTCSGFLYCLSCDLITKFRILNNITHRCPCTQGYFQSTSTFQCFTCHYSCMTCIDGNTCVSCITGRVLDVSGLCRCADGSYQNTTTNLCLLCTYPCSTCHTNSVTCLTCQSTHLLLYSASTCYCQVGKFQNTTQCQACLPSCLSCANSSQCTGCRPSDNRNLIIFNTLNLCRCVSGYHDQNNTIIACLACHYSCVTCINSISCTNCKDIRILGISNSGYCTCPIERYYDDGSNAVCLPCNTICLSCSGTSTNCTACSVSAFRQLFRFTGLGTATCICRAGYFSQPSIETCSACHYSCATCINSGSCSTCNSTLSRILSPSTTNYCSCSNGYYDVAGFQQCQKCSYTCQTCFQTSTNCLTCPLTRSFSASSCPCNAGLFDDMITNNATCFSCLYMCETCSTSSSCLTCPTTRFLNNSNLCPCLSGYYDTLTNKACQLCHPVCQQCIDYQICTRCSEITQLRVLLNNACVCQQGYFDMTVSNPGSGNYTCQNCHYSCQRCQNSQSCSSCNPLMFRIRDIMTSFCKCVDGYYDDGGNEMCLACSFDCLTCNDSTSCMACPSQRRLDTSNTPNRCVCSSAYYTDGTQCQLCPPQCATCTSYSSCTSCNNQTLRTLISGQCICNTKLFPISNSALCQSCHYSCATCTYYPHCQSCNLSAHRYLSAKQCKCFTFYYDDLTTQLCQNCHYSCLTCTNSSECLTCDTSLTINRIFNVTNKKCSCNVGFYEQLTQKICLKCLYSCYTCTSGNTCSSCTSSSMRIYNSINNQCECPSIGYFDQTLSITCINCDPTCYRCSSSSTYCTDCNTNLTHRQLTSTNACICLDGYYQSSLLTVICEACSYKCLTCTTSSTQCTACSISNNRDNGTIPSCSCFVGYYDDGSSPSCKLCDFRCATCVDSFKCMTCEAGTNHRIMNTISEICECETRYYQPINSHITRDPICLQCLSSCLTCNHPTLCLTCNLTGNTRYFSNGQCLCNSGYYDDGSGTFCLLCDYRCQTCASGLGCATCNPLKNRVYNISSYFCDCILGYYDIGNGVDSLCYACDQSCYTCTNSTSCLTCFPLANKYINNTEGTNFCICLYGYYQILSTKKCAKCHYSCQRCSGSSTSCTVCDSLAFRRLSSGSCICNSGYYDDGFNQLCLSCTTNCFRCFGKNAGQCLECVSGTYLLNGVCFNQCPSYYYPINATWICQSCPNFCTTCPDNSTCIICQSGFYLIEANNSNFLSSNLVCVSPCPSFYYHNTTNCLKCISPCLRCTGMFVCTDCIASYFLQNSSNTCYPCHSSCRYCTNGGVLDCISCIDGYYLNASIKLCQKLTCSYNQYVNSLYGCYNCQNTYPNSIQCNANTIKSCADGYFLITNNQTSMKECVPCSIVPGYKVIQSTGLCQQICGDGMKISDSCDDGNNLNGDGCSSTCLIQTSWQCTPSSPSSCTISQNFKPSLWAQSLKKVAKMNKIALVLVLNIGLRLVKQNFILQFKNLHKFQYTVQGLNSKYTRYLIQIQYLQSIGKDNLKISVVSPVQVSSGKRNLLIAEQHSSTYRFLQLASTLSISLQLQLSLQIATSPPAIYYSSQLRTNYTTIIYIIIIVLHVFSLLTFLYFIFFIRVKVMLYTIQFLNFITLLYMFSTYGLYNVVQLSSEAGRALQHFIYKFGEQLPEKYQYTNTSPGYYGFGAFILSGCIIQIGSLLALSIVKIIFGGSKLIKIQGQSLKSRLNPSSQTQNSINFYYSIFRYYHMSFVYSFMPELMLCCVIVFKWIQINNSIQSAYSWGIAIIVIIMVFIENGMYMTYAYPYARIIKKSLKNMKIINPLPFVSLQQNHAENLTQNKIISGPFKNITGNFVTIDEVQEPKSRKDNEQKSDKLSKYQTFNDPFAEQMQGKNDDYDKLSVNSKYEQISEKSYKDLIKNVSSRRKKDKKSLDDQENNTQAVIFDIDKQSQISHQNLKKQHLQTRSRESIKSSSTSMSNLQKMSLIPLYDLTPTQTAYAELSNINISYNRLILHYSYLPFKCYFLPLMICIIVQVQQPIPRCSLLILSQIVSIVYMVVSMRIRNTRFIKLISMSLILIGIASCGLSGKLLLELSSQASWANQQSRNTITNTLYAIQAVIISFILFGIVFNLIMYIYQCVNSVEYRQYKIQKRNKQILEKNIRQNRLRNINPLSNQQINQTQSLHGLKNIFSNIGHQTQSFQDFINPHKFKDQNDTKQHFRYDSEVPGDHNTSSNILMELGQNRRNNLEVIDIEDLEQEDEKNLAVHKRLKNTLQATKQNRNNSTTNKNRNKKVDEKQLVINSMQEQEQQEDPSNHHLQSTRINDNDSKVLKGFKGKNIKNDLGKEVVSFWERPNNYLSMLENELAGENSNETLMIVKQKHKGKQSDDTLISYKQSQELQNNGKKENKVGQDGKKGTFSIIKDLIPTRERDEGTGADKNKGKKEQEKMDERQRQRQRYRKLLQNQNIINKELKKKYNYQRQEQEQSEELPSDQVQDQIQGKVEGKVEDQEQDNRYRSRQKNGERHYKYQLTGKKENNTVGQKKLKNKNKKKKKNVMVKQQSANNKPRMKRSKTTNPYNIVPNNQLLSYEEQPDYQYEKQPKYNQNEQLRQNNTYSDSVNMLTLQLPRGLKDDGLDLQDLGFYQNRKDNSKSKSKGKKQVLKREKSPKNQRLRRIDSISSINDKNQLFGGQRYRFGEREQQSDESQGITVFKKILQDYQIYKNKKVQRYPIRRGL